MKKMTKKEKDRLKADPYYFISKYIFTQDPIHGLRQFPNYDYLKNLIEVTHREQYLLVPKSRQMMVSWTMLAYILWSALYHLPGLYLVLSRNERCAEELLERIRFMLDNLDPLLKIKYKGNLSEIKFSRASRILSLPATPHAPRMYSPTGVFWDEMAFTRYDEPIWTALKPALDHGGKFIGVSSSGGALNLFAKMVTGNSPLQFTGGDKSSQGGSPSSLFFIHPIHYSLHPDKKSEAWKLQASKGLSQIRWDREQEIDFSVETDLVYNEFSPNKHILAEEWKPYKNAKIFRTIDFGYRHPVVLWIQRTKEGKLIVFDEWVMENQTTEQLINMISEKDIQNGIREAGVSWTSCDPAGASIQDGGLSPVSVLRKAGIKLIYTNSRITTGIELVKRTLMDANGQTKLLISPRCQKLIADFQRYKWSPNGEEPLKDGISDHTMDALRYFFVNLETPDIRQIFSPRVRGGRR